MEAQKTLRLNLKYLKLCSEDEQRSNMLGMTSFSFWGELTAKILYFTMSAKLKLH